MTIALWFVAAMFALNCVLNVTRMFVYRKVLAGLRQHYGTETYYLPADSDIAKALMSELGLVEHPASDIDSN